LSFLEDEEFHWCAGKAADADLLKLIIFKEGLSGEECPPTIVVHLFDHVVVPVLAHIAEASGKNYEAALLHGEEHLLKE